MQHPEGIAKAVAIPMNLLSTMCAPVVWVLSTSTNINLTVFWLKPSNEPPVTEKEIRSVIEHGAHAGTIEEIEQDIDMDSHRIDKVLVKRKAPKQARLLTSSGTRTSWYFYMNTSHCWQ